MKHMKCLFLLVMMFSLIGCSNQETEDEQSSLTLEMSTNTTSYSSAAIETESTETVEESEETVPNKSISYTQEEEPDSPIALIRLTNAEQGVSGRAASKFFNTISVVPVYYEYIITDFVNNDELQITLALDEKHRSYTKISKNNQEVELLLTESNQNFLLDREHRLATEVSESDVKDYLISNELFTQMSETAEHMYFVGNGEANFHNQEVTFEEYTQDNKTFIRYYFADDMVLGHRSFIENRLNSETRIIALKNHFPELMDIFEIPDDFTIQVLEEDSTLSPENEMPSLDPTATEKIEDNESP